MQGRGAGQLPWMRMMIVLDLYAAKMHYLTSHQKTPYPNTYLSVLDLRRSICRHGRTPPVRIEGRG